MTGTGIALTTDAGTAMVLDAADPLAAFRDEFHLPVGRDGSPQIYLAGNSLGAAPRAAADYVNAELERWARLGVAGHFAGEEAWVPYHELLAESLGRLVGGRSNEVVAMNSLTVNLHLLMVSFYDPTPARHKILIEEGAFRATISLSRARSASAAAIRPSLWSSPVHEQARRRSAATTYSPSSPGTAPSSRS